MWLVVFIIDKAVPTNVVLCLTQKIMEAETLELKKTTGLVCLVNYAHEIGDTTITLFIRPFLNIFTKFGHTNMGIISQVCIQVS